MSSSMMDAMGMLNQNCPFDGLDSSSYGIQPEQTTTWEGGPYGADTFMDRFREYSAQPRYIPNLDGFINPYVAGMWNTPTTTLDVMFDQQMFGEPDKIDPNRIFSSDIASLKTLAADQAKIVKLFERKVVESLTDKGKFGVNEDDIEAMQALSSARTMLLSISKEQAAIKKNITELRIKQQQAGGPAATAGNTGGRPVSAFDVGRSVLDNIFDVPMGGNHYVDGGGGAFPTADIDEAEKTLNSIVPSSEVPIETQYENEKPQTFVVVDPEGKQQPEYRVFNQDGELMEEYPVPAAPIKEKDINRESKVMKTELQESYPVLVDGVDIIDNKLVKHDE